MIKGSVHLQRKAATNDTAFNHQLYDILDDKVSDDSDDEVPETKNQYFEFSNSYHIMRSIRLILFLQIIAIIIDNPAIQLSLFFDVCCKAVLRYSIHFYSRPFLDVLYVIQFFWQEILQLINSQNLPSTPSSVEISSRRLNSNPYGFYNDNAHSTTFSAVSLNPHYWHTMKHFSHYFLGVFFVVMSVLFTIRFWEISDYSNRIEITKWLHRYIADGWWRRGGLGIAISTAKGCVALGCCILVINAVSRNFSSQSITTGMVVGSIFFIGVTIVVVIWALGYMGIKFTEAAFVRYVSQNVAYTSAIILKRAVKAKIDLGILLMTSLYLPVLYTLLQSLLWFTDWNQTHTPSYRKGINHDVACYYMAFPPYREDRLNPNFCAVDQFSSPLQVPRQNGFYLDANILQCDSYLGITLYIFSAVLFVYMILGYFYLFFSLIHLVAKEFKASKWVDVLDKLIRIRDEEYKDYSERFPWWNRWYILSRIEIVTQALHCKTAFFWFCETLSKFTQAIIQAIWRPIRVIITPFAFLIDRLLIVSCLNMGESPKKIKQRRDSASQRTGKRVSFLSRLSFFSERSGKGNNALHLFSARIGISAPLSSNNNVITVDEEYGKSTKNSDRFDYEPWSISQRFNHQVAELSKRVNIFHLAIKSLTQLHQSLYRSIVRLPIMAYLVVSFNLFLHRTLGKKNKHGGSLAHGVASLGGSHAQWRKELTLRSKTRLMRKLRSHVVAELRTAKLYFISEHELFISFLDYTIDSSGLSTLIILYDYDRLYWFLVVLLELTVYAVFGAVLKQYTSWQVRNYILFCVNCVFGFLTYACNPYTEEKDRWYEFCGRVLVAIVAIGLVIYTLVSKDIIDGVFVPMYTPWRSFHFFTDLLSGQYAFSLGMVIDILTVIYFYFYLFYTLSDIGFFGVVDRMIQAFQFSYHDHVLDFLIDNLDQRSFGMENIFSGLEFVQQWDDVIKLQRRYALLAWPDIRPPQLISTSKKIFEVKWASLFNLTLKNLRSSLGLTILHITMFQGDGEVSRWIIHTNPDLLLIQDSQNDTPITIALKECAYYLMVYGEQNVGVLDDHTSYSDEDYAAYYPEVDDIRDEVFQTGEFMEELSIVTLLTAEDLVRLKEEGLYVEPKAIDYLKEEKFLKDRQMKSKTGYAMKFSNKNTYEESMQRKHDEELEKAIRLFKRKRKLLDAKHQNEKSSLVAHRFPEDDIYDNFESGQNSSWQILQFSVPLENVFIDKYLYQRYLQFPNYHYENHFHGRTAIVNTMKPRKSKKKSENNLSKNEFIDLEDTERNRFDESTDILDRFIDKDVQYVIPGNKAIHTLDNKVVIPLEDRLSSLANELPDWDRKLPRRNSSFSSERRDSVSGSVKSSNQSVHSDNSGLLNILTGSKQKQKNDRLANWKICKFAEILMSKEIRGACKDFRWDINDFKAFNKLASVNQGKIAQHLALVTRLNVPEGFVRLSDWSVGIMPDIYDERPEDDLNLVVKGIVALVTSVETAATAVAKMGDFFQVAVDVQRLRGRSKRSRSMRRSSKSHSIYASEKSGKTNTGDGVTSVHNREAITEGLLSDRVVQYLAETLVCSSPHLILDDCELSYNARRGWRAVARALRRRYCSFILPSVFMPPKPVTILSLILTRNELDCGDCVYMGDILMNQSQLRYLDLSYNRIGARGMNRMCKALKDHKCIETFLMQHNIMGPGCGHDIGLLLKATRSLKILNLAHNRLGEMVRFPTLLSREKLVSAAHDICTGLKYNKSIESLDLSYNHLGVTLGDLLPAGVVKHPKLNTLNIAGNDLGVQHGSNLVFLLAGTPLGAKYAKEKEQFIEFIQTRQRERLKLEQEINSAVHSVLMSESLPPILLGDKGESEIYGKETFVPTDSNLLFDSSVTAGVITEDSPALIGNSSSLLQPSVPTASSLISNGKVGKLNNEEENEAAIKGLTTVMAENDRYFSRPALNLTSLDVSNNQLGPFSGYAIAAAIEHMKGLTHLDVSGNSLGTLGADRITDALELCYGIRPREFIKTVLHDIEEKKYDPKFTRNAKKRKKRFTNLLSLNLSRNGIGPKVIGSLMVCCKSLNCTLIDLNVSDNPIGSNIGETSGSVVESAQLIRDGFMKNLSLISFNINRTSFDSTNLIAIFGGLAAHEVIQTICLSDIHMDEPCCLQLANVIQHCTSLKHLNLAKCKMGANGGVMICQKIKLFINRLEYLDLSENFVGPISAIYLAEALKDEDCKLRTLLMRSNDLMEAGGLVIAKSLIGNFSVTELDLSANHFTDEVAFYLADFARGLFKDGVKIRDSVLRKFMVNDNPMIGYVGAKLMVKSLANNLIDHFEISNIGAGPSTAEVVAKALRDPFIAWKNIKLSNNKLSRHGLNQIFWGMKNNKRLRILDVSENQAGTIFCSNEDALLSHGISVPVMLRNNVVLKELNLSYNTLVSEAGINIIDAIIDNHTIKKLSLRGNLLDDNIALILPDLLRCNNVLEELDIGYNRLGFASAYAIAESLEFNRSLKKLVLDYNSFGGSGTATLQCFMRSLMMNYSLQILNLDGNKLGPEWGKSFAETIVRNNTLIQFSLRDNRLDLASGSALLKAYKHNPYLIELALTSDEIGADLYEQFRQLFSNKRASIHPTAIDEETFLSPSQSALIATYHQFTHSSVQKKE